MSPLLQWILCLFTPNQVFRSGSMCFKEMVAFLCQFECEVWNSKHDRWNKLGTYNTTGMAMLIFLIGTKAKLIFGKYVFDQTIKKVETFDYNTMCF